MNTASEIFTIIGVAIGTFVLLFLVSFTILCYCRRKRYNEEYMNPVNGGICRRFTAEEIRNATNNFDRDLRIGDGGFGRVYKGYFDSDKSTPVAIKALKPNSNQGSKEFWAEIEMLSKLRHPHLVSLIGYCSDIHQRLMILVYEYMAHGTLRDHLYQTPNPSLPWKKRLEICIGAARGIKYLHADAEHSIIIHRDIKSSNILLDENWVPKVSDFGLSRLGPTSLSKSHVTTDVKGTFGYLDPSYYFTNQLSVKSDVYSFGVLLFEVLCGRPPVDMTLDEEQHSLAEWAKQHVKDGTQDQIIDPNLTGEIAPACLKVYTNIADKCLREIRNKRPTMVKVLKKLEVALKLQENADAAAEEGILFSECETEESSLRGNGSPTSTTSGCLVNSCPAFWHKKPVADIESLRFLSDKPRCFIKKRARSLRGLKGLFYTIFAYKSLPRQKQHSTESSSRFGPDLVSEDMSVEIMDLQEQA